MSGEDWEESRLYVCSKIEETCGDVKELKSLITQLDNKVTSLSVKVTLMGAGAGLLAGLIFRLFSFKMGVTP